MKDRVSFSAWIIFLFLALVWGSSFILIKRGLDSFSPQQVAAMRIIVAAMVLLPFVLRVSNKRISRQEGIAILMNGIFGNAIPAFLFPLAETHINSASAGVLNTLSPLFVLTLGVLFFGLAVTHIQIIGIVVGFGGATMLVLFGAEEVNMAQHIFYAFMLVLATVGYGLSTNIMKRYLNHTSPILATGYGLLAVSIPYSVYILFLDIPKVFDTDPLAWQSFTYVVILGAVGTALALVLFYRLVQLTEPIFSSSVTYVIPIVALLWGLLDGETFSFLQLMGIFVILIGVYLSTRLKPRKSSFKPVPGEKLKV